VPSMVEWMTPTIFAIGSLWACWFFCVAATRSAIAAAMGCSRSSRRTRGARSPDLRVLRDQPSYGRLRGCRRYHSCLVAAGALVQLAAERSSVRPWVLGSVTAAALGAGVLPSTASHLSDGTRFD